MAVSGKTTPVEFADLGVPPKKLLEYYREMLLIRRFEERAGQMYGMGLIGGFCHLYIGQEAVVVGMQAALKEGDTIVTSYRDHGHMLACGMDPKGVMAELTGRRTGYSRGKGGSMHMFSREKNFFGGHGIVGAQVPLGTGLAFSHRYKSDGCISVTANVAPRLCAAMQDAWQEGRVKDAMAIQNRLVPLHDALFAETSPGPVKFAASLLGKTSEHCRLPLAPLMEGTRAKVRAAMTDVGLLN